MRANPTASSAEATMMKTCASDFFGNRLATSSASRALSQATSRPPTATQIGWITALIQSSLCSACTTPRTMANTTKDAAALNAVCRMMRSVTWPCALDSSTVNRTTAGAEAIVTPAAAAAHAGLSPTTSSAKK